MAWKYILFENIGLLLIFLLAFVMAVALILFLSYHLYLISIGHTTNESFKWGELHYIYLYLYNT